MERVGEGSAREVICAVVGFCNAHILSSLNNRTLLVAGGLPNGSKKVLFSSDWATRTPNTSAEMDMRLREAVATSANSDENSASTRLAAAISLSLCG